MKNLDKMNQANENFRQKLAEVVENGDADAVAQAFIEFAQGIEQSVLADAQEVMQRNDATILASRGVRQLTSEETNYYMQVIDAMRSSNPKQALADLDAVMPKTTIDAVFEDLNDNHLSSVS